MGARRGGKPQKYFWTQRQDDLIVKHYDSKTATITALADAFKVPRWCIRKRAQELGVARAKEANWTREDEAFLERNYPKMSLATLCKKLKRSRTAVMLKKKRLGITKTADGYTLRGLEAALGVDHHKIEQWVDRGLLKVRRRGIERPQGDFWFVSEVALRKFICACPEEIDLRKVEKIWFIDLLAGVKFKVAESEGVSNSSPGMGVF